jgi:signal transduction histidine kinase
VVAIAVVVVVIPAFAVATSLRGSEEAEIDRRLERAAEDVAQTMEQELGRLADLAADVAISTTLVEELNAGTYATLLDRYRIDARFPALNGISYVERVPVGEVEDLLVRRAPGGPPLVLLDVTTEDLVRPVTMSYPLERNRAVLGVDLTSRPESRSAHDTAVRTGQPVLSDLTQIVQLAPGEPGASLHVPVPGAEPPATLGMVFSVGELFRDLAPLPTGVEIRLTDPHSALFPEPVILPAGEPLLERSATARAVSGGEEWIIEVVATEGYVQALFRRGSTWLALGGAVAGLLVGLLVFALSSRERHATELVSARTAEVRRTNEELAAANRELARANAQLEVADRDKDDFLAAVSHELRTPLTVIAGFVESMRWLQPTGDQLEAMLQPIERNVRRLDGLVADLLTLVSLDAGALISHPEPVRLREMLGWVPTELVGLPSSVVGVEVDGDPVASVDPRHLERILINLLANADRHGRPPIELSARQREDAVVELTVRDHGDGIPGEGIDVVFERFTRAPGKRAVAGTGLGLAIVRELTSLNGGGISYRSADPGACFTVWLPAAVGVPTAAEHRDPGRRSPRPTA